MYKEVYSCSYSSNVDSEESFYAPNKNKRRKRISKKNNSLYVLTQKFIHHILASKN